MLQIGSWYTSKMGALCKIDGIHEDGSVDVVSHSTGKKIAVPKEQAEHFTPTNDPKTPVGLLLMKEEDVKHKDYTKTYEKYPHIIKGSIYCMKDVGAEIKDLMIRKQKVTIKGSTRCKILCACGKERDIKVQDAFQVNQCEDCRGKKRKIKLQKMLKERSRAHNE